MSRLIVLDTETTGLFADNGDKIIEIGCVELINRKLTGHNFHHYINPERNSHEDALRVHGISNEFLRDKPKFSEIANDFLHYIKGAELIIHNAPFDIGFLNKELSLLGFSPIKKYIHSVTDTLSFAKNLYPGKRNSLDALCDRLGIDRSGRTLHGALLDAELLADVYIQMTRGQDALLIENDGFDHATQSIALNQGISMTEGRFRSRSDGFFNFEELHAKLPVLLASANELLEHEKILEQLDKSSQQKTVWRNIQL